MVHLNSLAFYQMAETQNTGLQEVEIQILRIFPNPGGGALPQVKKQ